MSRPVSNDETTEVAVIGTGAVGSAYCVRIDIERLGTPNSAAGQEHGPRRKGSHGFDSRCAVCTAL